MSEKQTIGIELPKETIEALLNGASKFIVPIDRNCEHLNDFKIYNDDSMLIECHSLLQTGDEFYVQEEFFTLKDGVKINGEPRKTAYKDDKGSITYNNEVQIFEHLDLTFLKPLQMTLEQSRIKGKIVGIEAGGVWDLSISDCRQLIEREEPNLPYLQSLICGVYVLNYKEDSSIFLYTVELQA